MSDAAPKHGGSVNTPTVLIGVTGCIAAYKTCEIIRLLQKAGVRVKVVMTQHATEFVGPLTFRSLTHEPVAIGLFDDPSDPIHHISLAKEADLFLIAPCTANVIAKLAHGIADDLLTTTALAMTAPIMIAPAMNVNMYEHPASRNNRALLHNRGVEFIDAVAGYLACGDTGKGKLADPEDIVAAVLKKLGVRRDLEGMHVMITAGPTREAIDPVRYISNHSSGKMGYALAQAAVARGARVTLISGPVSIPAPEGVSLVPVISAREMLSAAQSTFEDADIAIFAAAVSDMRPAQGADHKLKKGVDDEFLAHIELTKNPDILATLAEQKTHQVVVGFAAETHEVHAYAKDKLVRKHADMIVANEVGAHKGFGTDENEVWLVDAHGEEHIPRASKFDVAQVILDKALELRG